MDNTWFCKLQLLFEVHTKTGTGIQGHECAFVSVLEEYKGEQKEIHILHLLHISTILHVLIYFYTAWVDRCQSIVGYEHNTSAQFLYVVPVSSIL
jgi:hypothetical protein